MSGQTLEHMVEMRLVMCQPYHVVNMVHCQLGDASFHCNTLFNREIVNPLFLPIKYLLGVSEAADMPTLVTFVHDRPLTFTIVIRLVIGKVKVLST